jgi:quercetin 2,3-dioxygenase
LSDKDIPTATFEGGFVKVIAGEALNKKAKINTEVPIQYLDVHLEKKDSTFSHQIPKFEKFNFFDTFSRGHNSFVYVYSGSVEVNSKPVKNKCMVVFENEDVEEIEVVGKEDDTKILILSGKPIGEPIVQYGPFVMNTQKEIYQAFQDYQDGNFAQSPKISSQTSHDEEYDPNK